MNRFKCFGQLPCQYYLALPAKYLLAIFEHFNNPVRGLIKNQGAIIIFYFFQPLLSCCGFCWQEAFKNKTISR